MEKFIEIENLGVYVKKGLLHEPLSSHLQNIIEISDQKSEFVADVLKSNKIDVIINMISSGLDKSSQSYAKIAIESKCCFINCTPAPVVCDNSIINQFYTSELVAVGDDLMSQFGGTAFHKGILDFIDSRGIKILKSYQLDVGGGTETLNTIDEKVKFEKKKGKNQFDISRTSL